MKGVLALAVGSLASAALAACATTPATPLFDELTVSGRFGFAKADSTGFAGQARVARVSAHPAVAEVLRTSSADLDAQLATAFSKSMANHGYLAASDTPATELTAEVLSISLEDGEVGLTATATVRVVGVGAASAAGCFTRDGVAQFTALTPERASDGQRTFALVAGVLLSAAAGPSGAGTTSVWMQQQMTAADLNDGAANARREVSAGQGVAPAPGRPAAERFAGTRALQLAFADYVARLPEHPECAAAADGAAEPAALRPASAG